MLSGRDNVTVKKKNKTNMCFKVHIAIGIWPSKVFHRVKKIFLLGNFKSHAADGNHLQLAESSQCLSQVR